MTPILSDPLFEYTTYDKTSHKLLCVQQVITYIYVSRPCQQRWPQDDDQSASLAETETLQRLLNGLTWKILKSETIIISRGWLLMSLVISWLLFSATCRPKFFPRPLKYLHITNNVVQTFMLPDSVSCWQWCSPEPFVERNQAVDIRGLSEMSSDVLERPSWHFAQTFMFASGVQ